MGNLLKPTCSRAEVISIISRDLFIAISPELELAMQKHLSSFTRSQQTKHLEIDRSHLSPIKLNIPRAGVGEKFSVVAE